MLKNTTGTDSSLHLSMRELVLSVSGAQMATASVPFVRAASSLLVVLVTSFSPSCMSQRDAGHLVDFRLHDDTETALILVVKRTPDDGCFDGFGCVPLPVPWLQLRLRLHRLPPPAGAGCARAGAGDHGEGESCDEEDCYKFFSSFFSFFLRSGLFFIYKRVTACYPDLLGASLLHKPEIVHFCPLMNSFIASLTFG